MLDQKKFALFDKFHKFLDLENRVGETSLYGRRDAQHVVKVRPN